MGPNAATDAVRVRKSVPALKPGQLADGASADVKRTQNAYALNIAVGVADATVDTVGERALLVAAESAFRQAMTAVGNDHLSTFEAATVAKINASFDRDVADDAQAIALYRQNTPAASQQASALIVGPERLLFDELAASIDSLLTPLAAERASLSAAAGRTASSSRTILPIGGGAALILAGALAVLISRSLVTPLRATQAVLQGVAGGDLSLRLALVDEDLACPRRCWSNTSTAEAGNGSCTTTSGAWSASAASTWPSR